MKVIFDDGVMIKLLQMAHATNGMEFSGFGFVELGDENIHVYDAAILNVGSEVFTEINPEKLIELMQRPDANKMKLWFHRHPMGNGIPGAHNWSGTDENTIQKTPLGGIPEMMKWSVSAVLTLGGWVSRIDNYITHTTAHLEVEPQFKEVYPLVEKLRTKRAPLESWLTSTSERSSVYQFEPDFGNSDDDLVDLAFSKIVHNRFSAREMNKMEMTEEELVEFLIQATLKGSKIFDKVANPRILSWKLAEEIRQLTKGGNLGSY